MTDAPDSPRDQAKRAYDEGFEFFEFVYQAGLGATWIGDVRACGWELVHANGFGVSAPVRSTSDGWLPRSPHPTEPFGPSSGGASEHEYQHSVSESHYGYYLFRRAAS